MSIISAIQESSGVTSMMRYALMVIVWTYVGVVAIIIGVWTFKAVTGEPNWLFAEIFTGIVGTTIMLGLVGKIMQKRIEVSENIQEKQIESEKEIQSEITKAAKPG